MEGSRAGWSQITEWHTRTRPVIAQHYSDQLDAFDSIIKIQWTVFRRVISLSSGPSPDYSRVDNEERSANNAKVANAKNRLLAHIDAMIELDSTIEPDKPTLHESDSLFDEINTILAACPLPQQFKSVITQDLDDSQKAYANKAYKACVVMLGAAIEGFMLGTLQRTDVLTHLASSGNSAPVPIHRLGTGDPALADKIGNDLTFEDYKVCIHDLVQGVETLGVDNIQSFRNAIHPWKTIQEPLTAR